MGIIMKLTFKQFRILILVGILIYVYVGQTLAEQKSRSWQDTLNVIIYPINGDGSPQSQRTIDLLSIQQFLPIEQFLQRQKRYYGVRIARPVQIHIAPQIKKHPPSLPDLDSNVLSIMWWSLKMRWWAWYENTYKGDKDIRLFVEYYNDETAHSHISVGLQKGLLGLIKNYTGDEYIQRNNVIITHELLHTLGATDKYDAVTLMPIFPDGYAEPALGANSRQKKAEIMGGRIVYSKDIAIVPNSLDDCVIGEKTAKEIAWIM